MGYAENEGLLSHKKAMLSETKSNLRRTQNQRSSHSIFIHQFTTFINEILVAQSVVLKHS